MESSHRNPQQQDVFLRDQIRSSGGTSITNVQFPLKNLANESCQAQVEVERF